LELLMTQHGWIEVITGPMFSGKTEELIRRLVRARIARQGVVVFKPNIDDRFAADAVVSHSAQSIPSMAVANSDDIARIFRGMERPAQVVGIDEAQFFGESLAPVVEALADAGARVLIAGLDQDYLGRPFGPMPVLLAIADSVTKQHAVCIVCGSPATKSQRLLSAPLSGQVLVGAAKLYEARCRKCHVPGLVSAHEYKVEHASASAEQRC
jgi:thymidine kinase